MGIVVRELVSPTMRRAVNQLVERLIAIASSNHFRLHCALPGLLFLLTPSIWAQTPDDPIPSIIVALRAQQFEQALKLLQPALRRSPNEPRLWSLQGVALAGEGHKKEALTAFLEKRVPQFPGR